MSDILNKNEKQALINTLNVSGSILEMQIYSELKKLNKERRISQPPRKGLVGYINEERKEIDCLALQTDTWFVIEAKQSTYNWYFVDFEEDQFKIRKRLICPMYNENTIVLCDSLGNSEGFSSNIGFEAKINPEGGLSILKAGVGNKLYSEGTFYVERSERGQVIQDACIQAVSNLYWVIEQLHNENELKKLHKIIPTVITNAALFKLTVSLEDINEEGRLTNLKKIESVPFLFFELDWRLMNPLAHTLDPLLFQDPLFPSEPKTQVKSVLISQLSGLKKALSVTIPIH